MGADDNQGMSEPLKPMMSDPAQAQPAVSLVLTHLAAVEVQGADAGTFLQGQLTQDVVSMEPGQARAGGYCSAKGRLLANFIIVRLTEDAWCLITHAGLAPGLVKRLKMFVLRAKCTVRELSAWSVMGGQAGGLAPWRVQRIAHGSQGQAADPGGEVTADTLGTATTMVGWWGDRFLLLRPAVADAPPSGPSTDLEAWQHADIAAGWPWVEPSTMELFVPQMINFEVLGGVNFRKGCYPGQEVVARSQYRGTLKRRMALLAASVGAPKAGTEVFHSEDPGQPAGVVVNAAAVPGDCTGACLMLVEVKLAALESGSLHLGSADGAVLEHRALPYRLPLESEI
jgi:hypothetical protein